MKKVDFYASRREESGENGIFVLLEEKKSGKKSEKSEKNGKKQDFCASRREKSEKSVKKSGKK